MILDAYARQPSLNELAESVHLSPFHFHRRFCECTGTTPKHLLLDCQIELAQKELRSGVASMQQIAAACGFSHQSHFTSRFKQATGMTPSQWQKHARSEVA
jgi:AraC-like DNA-binding protein